MKIVFVDGFKIRNTLDDDFGNYQESGYKISSFYLKPYIPEGEFWVDHIFKDEVDFLIKLKDFEAPQAKNYSEEREIMKKTFCLPGPIPNFVQKKESAENGLNIVYVDGKIVRQYLDPEFIFGGHEFVYSYVPKNEIWIDAKTDPAEIKYIIIHEAKERELMSAGMPYDPAHDIATATDKAARRADGIGAYPGDENYLWYGLTNEEIIKQYVVSRM